MSQASGLVHGLKHAEQKNLSGALEEACHLPKWEDISQLLSETPLGLVAAEPMLNFVASGMSHWDLPTFTTGEDLADRNMGRQLFFALIAPS